MVRWLYALLGAFKQQWKTNADVRHDALGLVANIPLVAVIAWIATQSDRPGVLTYLAIGVSLMTLWNQTQIAMRWTIVNEAFGGTLEFNLLARVPLMMLLLGKALAHAASGMVPAVVAFATAALIAQRVPEPESVLGTIAAVGTAVLAVLATAFIFAVLLLIAASRRRRSATRPRAAVEGILGVLQRAARPFDVKLQSYAGVGELVFASHGGGPFLTADVSGR